jgi:outer membrane immunogenic protein
MRRGFLCAAGSLAAAVGAGQAAAADLAGPPRQVTPIVVVPAYVPAWAGFYIGFHGGGGWDHASFDVPGGASTFPAMSAGGGIFGGHAGYNWEYGPVAGGIEVDFSGADIKNTAAFFAGFPSGFSPGFSPGFLAGASPAFLAREIKTDELASARGRLGYALLPNLLAFGTAGIARGHSLLTVTNPATPASAATFMNEFGWVAGGGVEYRLFEHLLLRAEYLHYDFGRSTAVNALDPIGLPGGSVNIRNQIDIIRGGISYKF